MIERPTGRLGPNDLGGYVLESKLGQGGMGAVYRASHPALPGKAFALKVLLPGQLPADGLARFKREMQALAKAGGHPGVVKFHGGALDAPRPYFVMELVNGTSLTKLIGASALEPRRAAAIVRSVADAIAHAHAQGVLHRDLKPDNVMIEPGDRPRVCDFGLAVLAGHSRLTASNASMGTATFSAPEQLDGRAREADARADVYALGAILYMALAGRPPFEGSGAQLLKKVLLDAPAPLRTLLPTLSPALELVCLKALEKEPEQRYESVAALRDDLARWLAGEPVSVKPPGSLERLARWAKRSRRRIAATASGLVIVSGALAGARAYAIDRAVRSLAEARGVHEVADVLRGLRLLRAGRRVDEARAQLAPALGRELPELELPAFEERLTVLRREGVDEATIEHQRADFLDARAKALRKLAPRDRVERLVEIAHRLGVPFDLVGEGARTQPLRLGDMLVDAGSDADVSPADRKADLEAAELLIHERLESVAGDRAARFLRARVALARAGAPSRPLGPGRLDRPGVPDGSVLADLDAAQALSGAPGRRAAWLEADLLVAAGRAEGSAALARAQALGADSDDEQRLARVLAVPLTVDGYEALLAPLEARNGKAAVPGAALVLARFLARLGLRSALERPECVDALAQDPVDPAPAKVVREVALVDVDPKTYAPRSPAFHGDERARAELHLDGEPSDLCTRVSRLVDDVHTTEAQDLAVRLLRLDPDFPRILDAAATAATGTDKQAFLVLEMSRDLNGLKKLLNLLCGDQSTAVEPGKASDALARALDEDLATSPLVRVLRDRPELAGQLAELRSAVVGIRRVVELDDLAAGDEASPRLLHDLAFRAFQQLAATERLGGATVLPFRARLRRLAFPTAIGDWLAQVDLERMVWIGAHVDDLGVAPMVLVSHALRRADVATWLFLGADAAWRPARRGEPPKLRPFAKSLATFATRYFIEDQVAFVYPSDPAQPFESLVNPALQDLRRNAGFRRAVANEGEKSPVLDPDLVRRQIQPADGERSRKFNYDGFHAPTFEEPGAGAR